MSALGPRLAAVKIIAHTLAGGATHSAPSLDHLSTQERAYAYQLTQGTLNAAPKLQGYLRQLLTTPLKAKETEVKAVILAGLYQLSAMRTPDHAAVNESVELAKKLKKTWSLKLVNACLRRFTRERERLENGLSESEQSAHPSWLFNIITDQWPEKANEILAANNQPGPLCLRVNEQAISRSAYAALLDEANLTYELSSLAESCIRLKQNITVHELPGFLDGWVSVQDEAAQLAASLLRIETGHKVLDACSAPGGKACHIAEQNPKIDLIAQDVSPERLLKVNDNKARLGLTFKIEETPTEALGQIPCFDRILADVPCSGTGVIRRHPDIKLLRQHSDLEQFHRQQLSILKFLWPQLSPGGELLYVTCSIVKQENDQTIDTFLEQTPSAEHEPIAADWGVQTSRGRQLLPSLDGADGLYFSRLKKSATHR